jgi:hypothetical protein
VIRELASLGHGYLSGDHHEAPNEGIESVRGWIRCLLGREDNPDDHHGVELVRVRRWLSWVPQPDHVHIPVLDLVRKANAGDKAAQFRLMGVGGLNPKSLGWVERIGNEAFRQSENMAEWCLLMREMGVSPITCANFLLGLPLDGVIPPQDRMVYINLGLSLDILWATGLFLTPLDLVECVRPAKIRKAESRAEGELPPWSERTVVEEWSEEDFLLKWAGGHFNSQHLIREQDRTRVLKAAKSTPKEVLQRAEQGPQNHLFPDLARRGIAQVPYSERPDLKWAPRNPQQDTPEICSSATRILLV